MLLLRHENINGSVRCEYFNMDWRKSKPLKDCCKLEHGHFLFAESNDPDPKHYPSYMWNLEF